MLNKQKVNKCSVVALMYNHCHLKGEVYFKIYFKRGQRYTRIFTAILSEFTEVVTGYLKTGIKKLREYYKKTRKDTKKTKQKKT